MKFILNEKFILDERFILTEADSELNNLKNSISETLDKITDINVIDNLKNLLGSKTDEETKNTINKIEDASNKVDDQFDAGQKDLSVIKGVITDYLNIAQANIAKSDSSVGSALNSLSGIKKLIAKLEADTTSTPTTNADKEKLIIDIKADFNNLSTIIKKGLSDELDTPTDGEAYSEEIDTAVENINETKDKINGINKEADSIITGLQKFDTKISELYTKLVSNIEATSGEDAYDILNSVVDQCSDLNKLFNFNSISSTKHNWDKDFSSAGTDTNKINKVWDSYYATEWGKDAKKVMDLGPTFRTELTHGGFSEQLNPFVTFVKNNINELNLNATTYPAIHNAYVNDFISAADLRNNSNNLLYNKALYNKQAKEILDYLGYQSKIFNNFETRVKDIEDIYTSKEELASAIFDAGVSMSDGNFPKAKTTDLRNIASLKTLNQIKECMLLCFKDKSLSKGNVKADATAEKLIKEIQSNSIDLKKAIMQLAIKANTENNNLVEFVKSKGIAKAPDDIDIVKLEKIFSNYNIKGAKNLIKELAILGGLATEEELKD